MSIVVKRPRLTVANGTETALYGEAVLEFEADGVKEAYSPLRAVSAMENEGNTVCLGKKYGSLLRTTRRGNACNREGNQLVRNEREGAED